MAQAAAVASIVGSVGSLLQGQRAAKSQKKDQRALVAEQKKTQAEERARLNKEEAEQNRREASRTGALRGRLQRGRGATLFGSQAGVTTNLLGGGS